MNTETKLRELEEEVRRLKCQVAQPPQEVVPPGYRKCWGCGKIIKVGRWIGTLHLCN